MSGGTGILFYTVVPFMILKMLIHYCVSVGVETKDCKIKLV